MEGCPVLKACIVERTPCKEDENISLQPDVYLLMMQTPTLVDVGIWSFQSTDTGTTARTMSVSVVYALTK